MTEKVEGVQIAAPAAVTTVKPERKSLRKGAGATKTASKPVEAPQGAQVAAKLKEAAKAPQKAAAKVEFKPRKIEKGKPVYVLDQASRPVSGPLLLAHTHAALTVLGLLDASRPVVKKTELLTLIGQRAVTYHSKLGNLESAPDHGVRLSTLGLNTFSNRMRYGKINVEAANAFVSAFLDGKPDTRIHVTKSNLYAVPF